VLIFVQLKGSYVIMPKIIYKIPVTLVQLISDKIRPIMDVTKTGITNFVPVEWIKMLQMML